jgi:hypothetical protein
VVKVESNAHEFTVTPMTWHYSYNCPETIVSTHYRADVKEWFGDFSAAPNSADPLIMRVEIPALLK